MNKKTKKLVLFVYTKNTNLAYVESQAKKKGVSKSKFVDAMIQAYRTNNPISYILRTP